MSTVGGTATPPIHKVEFEHLPTKREEFAKAAMQGILSCDYSQRTIAGMDQHEAVENIATWAVGYADALLKALEETK